MTSPRLRIHAVSELTGVPTATLRAWERRYGFPSPGRSSSAYRLYSDRDVELVKRMRAMIDSGVSPHEAAEQLVHDIEEAPQVGLDPAVDPYALAASRIVEAAAKLDGPSLDAELRRAIMLDSGATAFERVLRPALVEIGERWHSGEISVASEHFATHLIASATLDLLRLTTIQQDGPAVLLACFSEEQHLVALYGAALEVASWGYRPLIVGASTPPTAITRAREALSPAIIGLSATILPTPPSRARELVDAYADACGSIPMVVGGAAAEGLGPFVRSRGGHVMPLAAAERRSTFDRLVTRGAASRSPATSSNEGRKAATRRKRAK